MSSGNIITVEELAELHQPGQRLFGLDLGTKTIGIAVSDGLLRASSRLETIQRTKFSKDVARILDLCGQFKVCALVMGLPLNMDGSEGPRAQATRAFVRNLAQHTDLPVIFWDERLSTVAAERVMIEADMSRRKRALKIDAAAAAFILQGVLDRIEHIDRGAQH